MSGGLMVVVAHPDDEVLIAGGVLAAFAAAGLPTAVLCLTEGEQGPIADPALAVRATLGAVRRRELEAACAELGVSWVRCFRRADGNLAWCGSRVRLAGQIARAILIRRPDAVVTFGEDGLYYHPDHIATFSVTRQAMMQLSERSRPALYRSVWPADLMTELAAELESRGLARGLWGLAPGDFGAEDEDRLGEVVLDVRPFAAQKLRALRCHRTQLGAGNAFAALPEDLAERFLGVERFVPVPVGSAVSSQWLARLSAAPPVHA